MNPIIEEVARAMEDCGAMSSYAKAGHLREARSRAAIRATLEHYMENVSDKAAFEGMASMAGDMFDESDMICARQCFKAMLSQALAELDP